MPEYTLSLLIWIAPITSLALFFHRKNILSPVKRKALAISISLLALVGIILDLAFAHRFFTFPNPEMTLGWHIQNIPVEEFAFYITGFWAILVIYIFLDEWLLAKYNPPDSKYARFAHRIPKTLILHRPSAFWGAVMIVGGIAVKHWLNPVFPWLPQYFTFLAVVAYTPMILFYRLTKSFVNWRAWFFTVLIVLLLSVIWEVTLAIPRGYWGYQEHVMLGIFLPAWHRLPLEAVTVWPFSSLAILVYEYIKIVLLRRPAG